MTRSKCKLAPAEIEEIEQFLKSCTDGCDLCRRLCAVLLYGTGHPLGEVQQRYGCSRSSLIGWCKDYRYLGIDSLVDLRKGGNNARLAPHQMDELFARLRSSTPRQAFGRDAATPDGERWTAKDLYRALREWYGVTYRSRNSYYRLLERLGKPGTRLGAPLPRTPAANVQF